jgi:hypothetical protein
MGLDKEALEIQLKEAFEKAKATQPPEDPEEIDRVQKEILKNLAIDLAGAIDAFVRSGDVVGVTTRVVVDPQTGVGTGTQEDTGHIL